MKSIFFYFIAACMFLHGRAQDTVSLDDLKTPVSPGFVLLGVEPASIERPTTPKGLATSLISAAGLSGMKPNYALEVAPYWLKSHPALSFDDYYHPKSVGENFRQSFSVSLATAETNIQQFKAGTGLGAGLKFQLLSGKAGPELIRKRDSLISELSFISGNPSAFLLGMEAMVENDASADSLNASRYIESMYLQLKQNPANIIGFTDPVKALAYLEKLKPAISARFLNHQFSTKAELLEFLGTAVDDITDNSEAIAMRNRVAGLGTEKTGFVWEFAFAGMMNFPGNDYELSYFTKAGAWTTLGYKLPNGHFDILFLGRYLYNAPFIDSLDNADIGGSLAWHNEKFSIAFEGLWRNSFHVLEKDVQKDVVTTSVQYKNSSRMALNFQWKINDYIYFTGSFGKNFEDTKIKGQNLISVFGINYNLNNLQKIKLT